jgi:hypothetical protein
MVSIMVRMACVIGLAGILVLPFIFLMQSVVSRVM